MAEKRLYDAAVEGDVKSLLDLLKEDPLILDRVSFTCSNKTPLHIATICQRTAFVQEIVQRNPLLAAELDSHQSSALHIASAKGYAEIVKDEDGDTILHLAVRTIHFETVQYLMGSTGIDVNAKNANGHTALDILELTPTYLRDANNYLSIKNCLQPKACNSINPQTQPIKWLTKKRDAIMVVAILIATMAFQAGVTPPGGVWQDNATDDSHKAGEAVMASIHPKALFMWSLMVIMWLTVTSTAVTYAVSIVVVTPEKNRKSLGNVIEIGLIVWCSVMAILLVGNTVRLVDRWLQKRGITVWRPRRFRDLVEVQNRNVNQEGV
ncbi:unnamed protein product [Fraxinus pennsylvanica]|uniref:PGG domain-containing protein n=1 Tax=Fraxinus pennsylvanica TaxID=56036 RepID=A0AAD2ABU8_9LAMI|nr:unnamed protein product [Fraxinus pennsylvanica]